MPTQAEMDKATADFLHYTQRVSELTAQGADLQREVDLKTAQKDGLERTISDTNDAMVKGRQQLLDIQAQIDDLLRKKAEEEAVERAAHDANQKSISEQTTRLNGMADELQRRGFGLDDREKALGAAQLELNTAKQKLLSDQNELAKKDADQQRREDALVTRSRDLDARETDVSAREKTVGDRETAATASEDRARAEHVAAENERQLKIAEVNEVKAQNDVLAKTKEDINRLLPVLKEFYDYVKTHQKDPDGVASRLEQLFPLAASALNQVSL